MNLRLCVSYHWRAERHGGRNRRGRSPVGLALLGSKGRDQLLDRLGAVSMGDQGAAPGPHHDRIADADQRDHLTLLLGEDQIPPGVMGPDLAPGRSGVARLRGRAAARARASRPRRSSRSASRRSAPRARAPSRRSQSRSVAGARRRRGAARWRASPGRDRGPQGRGEPVGAAELREDRCRCQTNMPLFQ